jgi:hypothetical protein
MPTGTPAFTVAFRVVNVTGVSSMIDDYLDKLNQLLGRLTTEQVRQVYRFAQFIYEDQEPEGMQAREDPAERYQEFVKWCQSSGIDLDAMSQWSTDASGKTIQTVAGDEL